MDRSLAAARGWHWLVRVGCGVACVLGVAAVQAQELCGGATYPFPYTDVSGVGAAFCPGIMEAYVTGVSKGTTPTTFSPNTTVTRVAMTTFLQRSLDQGLARTSRRAALNQWWTPQSTNLAQSIAVGATPKFCAADGESVWTSAFNGNQVVQVRASTGAATGTWTGATMAQGILAADGKIFVVGGTAPGNLYLIDPTQAPGAITTAASTLGNGANSIAFDGARLWTANFSGGSVSIITPAATTPYPPGSVTTVSTGFSQPLGIVYDGAHMWVSDYGAGTLLKLDGAGAILQTVTVGAGPGRPAFDGTNLWVPNETSSSITVVQASSGSVVATIGVDGNNLLDTPTEASFDGERILVTNQLNNSVTLFKAADLSLIGNVALGIQPFGACSDGVNFWVTDISFGNLLRF